MTFELFLRAGSNDQIGHPRRQEAAQPAHAFDFAYLVGDALFELLIEFDDLLSSFAELTDQSSVLNGNDCLVGKSLDQLDLLLGKWQHIFPAKADHPDWRASPQQRAGAGCSSPNAGCKAASGGLAAGGVAPACALA
jgi:hypothetical protein